MLKSGIPPPWHKGEPPRALLGSQRSCPRAGGPWEPLRPCLGELRPSEKGAVGTVALTTLC